MHSAQICELLQNVGDKKIKLFVTKKNNQHHCRTGAFRVK